MGLLSDLAHPIAAVGRAVRARSVRGKPVAECLSGHDLYEDEIAEGRCPVEGCPTPDLGLDEGGEE